MQNFEFEISGEGQGLGRIRLNGFVKQVSSPMIVFAADALGEQAKGFGILRRMACPNTARSTSAPRPVGPRSLTGARMEPARFRPPHDVRSPGRASRCAPP